MAKRKTRRPSKTVKLSGLGSPPEEHLKRGRKHELDAVRFLRDVENEADAGRCNIAFDRLIDGVTYAAMAEADAQGANNVEDVAPLQSLTASTIRYYRKNCMGVK